VSKFIAAALSCLVLAATACGQPVGTVERPDVSDRKLRLVATTGMVGDLAAGVAGNRAEVTSLMGPGIDPHVYKASEGDVLTLAEADAIFYNGLHLEAKMADVLERIEGRLLTVPVAQAIPEEKLRRPPEFEGAFDPHVWFDVTLWREALGEVERALTELDPAHESFYRGNARRYRTRLTELDAEVRRLTATVPEERRVLVTAHDAFGYFGAAYGFEVRGLQGISTAAEAGAGDVQALAEFIAERRIPSIFVESSVPRQTVRAVQEATRSRGFDVQIGAQLFSDAMGDAGTPEGTYPGMVLHNVRAIVAALGGDPDAR
jgi:manganese/zinc/iron transport system substrate-binding protein